MLKHVLDRITPLFSSFSYVTALDRITPLFSSFSIVTVLDPTLERIGLVLTPTTWTSKQGIELMGALW